MSKKVYQQQEELKHFGILGMKWGKRRNLTPSSQSLSRRGGKPEILTKRWGDKKIIRRKPVSEAEAQAFIAKQKKVKLAQEMKNIQANERAKKAGRVVGAMITAYSILSIASMVSGMNGRSNDAYNAAYTQWLRNG